jgi:polyisoprenoid-binding protein YceI
MNSPLAILALLATITVSQAGAVEYNRLLPEKSSVGFSYQQMGVRMEGRFRKFEARLAFDPARPAAAKASFDVELASVDAGSGDADQELAGKSWFDPRGFPVARFVSSGVQALGGNRYQVAGRLTIKGRSQDVVVPVSLTTTGTTAALDGSFTIRRADFAIGEGSWAQFDVVANDVVVKIHLVVSN